MNLNHINLTVEHVLETRTFLERYFGLHAVGEGAAGMAFLTDDNGTFISVLKGSDVSYPKTFHIGFRQASESQVNALHQRLLDDGINAPAPGGFTGRGRSTARLRAAF